MTANHSTKVYRRYLQGRKDDEGAACPFCSIDKGHEQYVEETARFKVIRNRLPYSIWDGQGVLDHLMITPKKHTDSLKGMEAATATEYLDLASDYEHRGYNLYARSPGSNVKSVIHQHTHLIRLDGKDKRFVLVLRKPFYVRLSC